MGIGAEGVVGDDEGSVGYLENGIDFCGEVEMAGQGNAIDQELVPESAVGYNVRRIE